MADVIAKLQVDSSQYDQRLKSAIEQMTKMEKEVRRTGATFAYADKEELEFIKSLGSMETKATSAKGKINEMNSAFTEWSLLYKRMTDEEKASPLGAALSQSLDQLKGRIQSAKADLAGVEQQLSGGMGGDINLGGNIDLSQFKNIGSIFNDLGSKIGIPTQALSKLGGSLGGIAGKLTALGPSVAGLAGPFAAAALAVQQLVEAFKRNDDAMNALKKNAVPTISIFQQIQRLFDDTVQIFVDVNNATGGLVDTFQRFNPALLPLKALIAVVRTRFALWHEEVRVGATVLEYALGWIKKFGSDSSIVRWAKNALAGVEGFFTGLANKIEGIANTDFGKAMGLDKLYADLKNIWGSDRELNETNKQIIALEDNIRNLQDATTRADADSNVKISDLRAKAAQADKYTEEQRLAFLKEALQEEENMANRRYEIAKKQYELAQKKASRTNSSDADKQEVSNAYAAMRQEEIALNEARRALARPIASLTNKVEGTSTVPVEVEPEVVIPEGSIAAVRKQLQDLQKSFELAPDAETRSALQQQMDALNQQLQEMQGKVKQDPVEVPIELDQNGLSTLKKKLSEKLSGADFGTQEYKDAAANLVDFETFSNLLNMAVKKGLDIDSEWMSSLFEDVKIGSDVKDSTWQALLDNLNKQLQEKGLEPLKLDFETGNLEEIKVEVKTAFDEMRESLDKMSTGVGAISTIGNAFNELKGIGEDLASAFSGEMDAWDSLMTVFNSGIGIMQTVIGVMEAINTLQALSGTLSDQKKEKQLEETTTVVGGKMAEQQANIQEAGTSMTAAGADAAESSAKAGKSVAGIPIVGPILAVAAIAAVLAATFAAMSKAKSAGKSGGFATGGIIPGNSFSGDNLTANVNSGELILNRAQQASIAGQLSGGATQTVVVEGRISGKDILLSANNTNRAAGGSRGYYTQVK